MEAINYIKEKQKEYHEGSAAYHVLRELEITLPNIINNYCQSQKAKAWEEGLERGKRWREDEENYKVSENTTPINPYKQ